MRILKEHSDSVRCVAYSPDGRLLASGGEDNRVVLWDLNAGLAVGSLQHDANVERLVFRDKGYLITGDADGWIRVWDVQAEESLCGIEAYHPTAIRDLALSPDGLTLASLCWENTLKIRHAHTLSERFPELPALGGITALAFLSSGEAIAIARTGAPPALCDLGQWSVGYLVGEGGGLCIACTADDRLLVTGMPSGTIQVWELRDKTSRPVLQGHSGPVYAVAFTPDGRSLLSGGADGTVRSWDVEQGRESDCFRWHASWVTCLAVAPDGMTAAAGSDDGSVVVWDLADAL